MLPCCTCVPQTQARLKTATVIGAARQRCGRTSCSSLSSRCCLSTDRIARQRCKRCHHYRTLSPPTRDTIYWDPFFLFRLQFCFVSFFFFSTLLVSPLALESCCDCRCRSRSPRDPVRRIRDRLLRHALGKEEGAARIGQNCQNRTPPLASAEGAFIMFV